MGLHDGHRERMRKRFLTYGMDSLEDHEVLELLLFFAFSRGDVNPLAHTLINQFGSLQGVMDATFNELTSVKGVGPHTAYLIMLTKPLCRRYMLSQNDPKQPLNSVDMFIQYLVPYFFGAKEEHVYLLCLDVKGKPICCQELSQGSATSTELPIRRALQLAMDCKAVSVILAHNHPNGEAYPSREDIAVTDMLRKSLQSVGVQLADHIIFGADGHASFAQAGLFY